jgi:Holliday junction resolvasome RuvABC endonuclease subunit
MTAVVGPGGADKTQVAYMIARLLPTAGGATADAADALAVAIAHAHARKARAIGQVTHHSLRKALATKSMGRVA